MPNLWIIDWKNHEWFNGTEMVWDSLSKTGRVCLMWNTMDDGRWWKLIRVVREKTPIILNTLKGCGIWYIPRNFSPEMSHWHQNFEIEFLFYNVPEEKKILFPNKFVCKSWCQSTLSSTVLEFQNFIYTKKIFRLFKCAFIKNVTITHSSFWQKVRHCNETFSPVTNCNDNIKKQFYFFFLFIVGTSCILNNVNNGELDAISIHISHNVSTSLW